MKDLLLIAKYLQSANYKLYMPSCVSENTTSHVMGCISTPASTCLSIFMSSLTAVGSLCVLWRPPTTQRNASRSPGESKLPTVS